MMRFWIGTALLAGSWLLGLDYFYPANPCAWLAAVAAAVLLLGRDKPLAPSHRNAVAIALLLPAVWFASFPYRAAPLLIVLGLAIQFLPIRKRWSNWLAAGAITTGVVLLAQALILEVYAAHTARSHELPWPLPDMLAGVATLLGIDATADGSNIVMHSMRQTHRLAATWELLLDPATLLFFIGGLAMLACSASTRSAEDRADETSASQKWQAWIAALRTLTLIVIAWLPIRAGLLMALYLHRVLRSDPDRPLHAMNHFFSPWVLLLLLIAPVLLAWRFIRSAAAPAPSDNGREPQVPAPTASPLRSDVPRSPSVIHRSSFIVQHSLPVVAGLIALAVALFTAAIYWCPVGGRKDGRVMVVERHSKWEPTNTPYDTKWFVEPEPFPDVNSGYNYARVYRYLEQYYDMSRLSEKDKIDDATLAKCDVLIIKTPTVRYSPQEVEAVVRFVEQGGGLLLVGDHTNYERSSTIMNDITRPMGFIFRDDLLFCLGPSPDEQLYVRPNVPHPAVQHVPLMDFAVSCSIDPGHSRGRPVIENTGLWSLGPEYHYENFHPYAQHCSPMRYGAFIQTWAARHGQGRAIAFTDSTIFSNFCVGQPGKSELMLGMVEWLNHANPWLDPRIWLLLLGLATLAAALWISANTAVFSNTACHGIEQVSPVEPATMPLAASEKQQNISKWLLLLSAGTCGWAIASLAIVGVHRCEMPTPKCLRPERCVVIDRTTSTVPLSKGAYTRGGGIGYGLFEQWLARLDCRTVRKEGAEAFTGDVLVAICPNRSVPEEFRNELEQYVRNGGKLLVIDSPENDESRANSLLWPFGLSIHHDRAWKGKLATSVKLPTVDVEGACEVIGGQPIAKLDKYTVAAVARHGKGSVMAVGFGSLWNDTRMGESWMMEPDATTKARFDVLFGLAGRFFDGKPWPQFAPPPKEKPKADKDSLLKESGPAEL